MTKREEWDSAWKEAEEKLGSVTLLVNNAGVPPEAGWRTCMEVMGKGAFIGTEITMEKMGREKVRFFFSYSVAALDSFMLTQFPCSNAIH